MGTKKSKYEIIFKISCVSHFGFMLLSVLPRSYMITTNLSIVGRIFRTLYVVDISTSVRRAVVTSLKPFHTDQAIRFTFPANADVTLYPVKA